MPFLGSPVDERFLSDVLGRRRGSADAVVFPVSTGEVSAVLKYAYARGIPVAPRGAVTNLVGSTVPVEGACIFPGGWYNFNRRALKPRTGTGSLRRRDKITDRRVPCSSYP